MKANPRQYGVHHHRDVTLESHDRNNARDIEQRLVLLQCPLNEKHFPLLGDAELARRTAPVTFDEPEAVQVDEEEILTRRRVRRNMSSGRKYRMSVLPSVLPFCNKRHGVSPLRAVRRRHRKKKVCVTPDGQFGADTASHRLGLCVKTSQYHHDFLKRAVGI